MSTESVKDVGESSGILDECECAGLGFNKCKSPEKS